MLAGWRIAALVACLGCTTACAEPSVPIEFEADDEPAEPELADCTTQGQNQYVYDVVQQYYLWEDELEPTDPTQFDTPKDLLRELRVEVDRWSYITEKSKNDAWYMEGKFLGLGLRTVRDEDMNIWVTQVYPGSPTAVGGFGRGDRLTGVNGMKVEDIDEQDLWGTAWGEDEPGVEVDVEVERADGEIHSATVVRDWVSLVAVPNVEVYDVGGQTIGYLKFQSFIEPGYAELDAAFAQFQQAGVTKLAVDLRYNGGGLLAVARHFASLMVAEFTGEVMYSRTYNEIQSDRDREHEFKELESSVNVDAIAFITTARTKSASELVINALRPYVDVSIVGTTTGGKPVGMKSFEFCEQVLWPITFRLVNSEGTSDYYDGIAPDCPAEDDLMHQLGDANEASLAAAIEILTGESCPASSVSEPGERSGVDDPPPPGLLSIIGAR